jgi:magnesium transporter
MKAFTIVSTIFLPLTLISGIYGMNFEFMPELKLRYGYFIILGFMACIAVGLILVIKRKKWI